MALRRPPLTDSHEFAAEPLTQGFASYIGVAQGHSRLFGNAIDAGDGGVLEQLRQLGAVEHLRSIDVDGEHANVAAGRRRKAAG
jgi:hypothetical protein